MQQDDDRQAGQDDEGGEQVQGESLPPERCDEARTELKADRVDEKNQPGFPGEIHHVVIDADVEMTKDQPGKEHPGNADADLCNAEPPERESKRRHEAENEDRLAGRLLKDQ